MKGNIFIKRPVMAISISILIVVIGLISLFSLPVEQYPDIAPPTVQVSATYTGADAEAVMNSVIMPLEESINGVEDMMYITSTATNAGTATIEVYFKQGTDPDMAAVNVQNRVSKAQGLLPAEVTKIGVTTQKRQTSFLQINALASTDGRYDKIFLGNYMDINVIPQIKRVEGVGDVMMLGDTYSMRIWLHPERMAQYGLVPSDVTAVLGEQNIEAPTGSLGENSKNVFQFTMKYRGRLKSVDEFRNTVVRAQADGSVLRLKDVADVELGTQTYSFSSEMDGKPAVMFIVFQTAGSNATAVNESISKKMKEMEKDLPQGTEFVNMMSSNDFLFASIHNVVETLVIAIILVVLVVYFFLQDFKSTLIPSISIIVSLIGTFACLMAAGFSINILTLFALVLAIGTVVDDAIVVVENVERVMMERRCDPKTATVESMQQITGALIGIAMVLSAVFVPMAFFGGSTGVIYRQFSVTIVSAMALSVVVALTLIPALCASILKQIEPGHEKATTGFFGKFNQAFDALTSGVRASVRMFVRRISRLLVLYAVLIGAVVLGFMKIPSAFMPGEDQGVLLMMLQTPASATAERTDVVVDRFQRVIREAEKKDVEHVFTVRGYSFAGTGQNNSMGFIKLKDWSERKDESSSANAVMMRSLGTLFSPAFKDAQGYVFQLPAVPELGVADGFDFFLQDRSGQGHDRLMQVMNEFLAKANADPRLRQVRHNGMPDAPMVQLNVDYEKARTLGVSESQINTTLNAAFGSSYVNDFMDQGRLKKVYVQGIPDSRGEEADLAKWHVKSSISGQMVPFSSFVTTSWTSGSPCLDRFNAIDAVNIQGSPAPGVSSGEAMQAIEEILQQMPHGYSIEWNGVSYQERVAGSNAAPLYALSVLVVFLALAALYESWTIPIAVILVVPTGVVGALGLTWICGKENDVYFQVGLLTTVGLVSKNAILIVEFARDLHDQGQELLASVVEAVRLRLRPILMTSLAFGLGVLPLAMASGAGAGAQSAIGVAVLGGMLTGTFLCIFFVPAFFVLVTRIFSGKKSQPVVAAEPKAVESQE